MNKPEVKTRTTRTRDVKMTLTEPLHRAAIIIFLRRNYPQFRGFEDQEIDFDFLDDGIVNCHAYKEYTK